MAYVFRAIGIRRERGDTFEGKAISGTPKEKHEKIWIGLSPEAQIAQNETKWLWKPNQQKRRPRRKRVRRSYSDDATSPSNTPGDIDNESSEEEDAQAYREVLQAILAARLNATHPKLTEAKYCEFF